MTPSREVRTALAVLCMLLFIAALGARAWVAGRATDLTGPDHIAARDGQVVAHLSGELLLMSADGALLARQTLAALDINDAPIDLRLLGDGRILVALQHPASLRLCEPRGWQCRTLDAGVTSELSTQYKVWPDEAGARLLIVDFDSGRLWSQPLAGGEAIPLLAVGKALKGPNDLAVGRDGRLWIADSRGRRILAYTLNDKLARPDGHEIKARHRLTRDNRDWPMMLAEAPDGLWWVVQPDSRGRGADLLIYHPRDGVQARVELPGDGLATDIAAIDGAMLVTDMQAYRIHRVDLATHAVSAFGDAAVRARLAEVAAAHARTETWAALTLVAMGVFGVLMIGLAVWATPKGERLTSGGAIAAPLAASDTPAPVLSGVHWLARHPGTERLLRWLMPLSYVSVVLALASLVFAGRMLGGAAGPDAAPELAAGMAQLKQLMWLSAAVFCALPWLTHLALHRMRIRLGSDGRRLYLRLPDGRQQSFAPEQLLYNDRQIAGGPLVVAVQTGNRRPLYADGEIETHIAPLLARARRLNAWGMFRHQLAQRDPVLLANLLFAVAIVAGLAATGLWRMFPGLSH